MLLGLKSYQIPKTKKNHKMDSVYKDIGVTDINRRCEIHKIDDRLHSQWLNKWLHRSTERLKKDFTLK